MAEERKKQEAGLRSFRSQGGAEIRVAHPEWGRPNKKRAARIAARIKVFEAGPKAGNMHRPGSGRKPI